MSCALMCGPKDPMFSCVDLMVLFTFEPHGPVSSWSYVLMYGPYGPVPSQLCSQDVRTSWSCVLVVLYSHDVVSLRQNYLALFKMWNED